LNFYYNNARKIFKLRGSEGGDFLKKNRARTFPWN